MSTEQRQNTFFKINYGLLLLTAGAFFFSRYIFFPLALVWFVVAIAEWNWRERFNSLKQSGMLPLTILFLLFYALYLFGPLHSENTSAAISDWEYKIWFLVCPISIMPLLPKLSRKQLDLVLVVFTIAIALVAISCMANSCIMLVQKWQYYKGEMKPLPFPRAVDCFTYTRATALPLGTMGHPSYCAMYEICAWLIAAEFLRQKNAWMENKHLKRSFIAAICLFPVHILLLQSKIGVILLAIIATVFFIITYCTNWKRILAACILLCSACAISLMFISKSENRVAIGIRNLSNITERADHNPSESNAIRLALWQNSMELIEDHWAFGIGNGDIFEELQEKAVEHNYTYIAKYRFNSHSQFLQCWLGLGLLGLVLLTGIIAYAGIASCKGKSLTSALIVLTFALNLLVESMLEQYSGATFIPIFIGIFTYRALIKPCGQEMSESHNPSNPPSTSAE